MKKLLIGLIILIVAGSVLYVLNYHGSYAPPPMSEEPAQPGQPATTTPGGDMMPIAATTTVTGTFVCLPHKGTGPSTLECAFGMKGDDGAYYALDWGDSATSAFDLPMGKKYAVMGLFTPVEALSSNHWQVYDIKGVIKVSSYNAYADTSMPSMPLGSAILELKTPVKFKDTTLSVTAVTEDSRCPSDVTCIQAGRVKVALTIQSPSAPAKSVELIQGETVTTDTLSFTLNKVTPYPVSTHKTTDDEYRFAFTVTNK